MKVSTALIAGGSGWSDSMDILPQARGIVASRVVAAGSISKVVMTLACLRAQQEGDLDLDARLDSYLPTAFLAGASVPTCRQVLSHTGGLPALGAVSRPLGPRAWSGVGLSPSSPEMGLRRWRSTVDPGLTWTYSNFGAVLVAAMLERIYSEPYTEIARRLVLLPCGMKSSGFEDDQRRSWSIQSPGHYSHWLSPSVGPAAGLLTCLNDLASLSEAIVAGSLFSKANRAALFSPVKISGGTVPFSALGFRLWHESEGQWAWHGGQMPGANVMLAISQSGAFVAAVGRGLVRRPPSLRSLVRLMIQSRHCQNRNASLKRATDGEGTFMKFERIAPPIRPAPFRFVIPSHHETFADSTGRPLLELGHGSRRPTPTVSSIDSPFGVRFVYRPFEQGPFASLWLQRSDTGPALCHSEEPAAMWMQHQANNPTGDEVRP